MKITNVFPMIALIAMIGAWCPACGGGGGSSSTDLPSDTGGGADDPIANALARIAINAALDIGLGLSTNDELFKWANVPALVECGENPTPAPDSPAPNCNFDSGETAVNCPADCSCGDGVCDASETVAGCPSDCSCGNGRCDEYGAGESSVTCPADCQPVCGDDECSTEELYTTSCPADCEWENNSYFGSDTLPTVHGIPAYKCVGPEDRQGGAIYVVNDAAEGAVSGVYGLGICGYGYRNDDVNGENVTAIFVDFTIGMTDVPINGYTFTCVEEMYDGMCMEGSAMLVFQPDGTLKFYAALSGKVYAYREDPPEALTIVGAAASGTITLPPFDARQTCMDLFTYGSGVHPLLCPEIYRYKEVSIGYDIDGDGADDYDAYYLEADGSITAPAQEICQSFMIDWTMIRPDRWFGDNDPAAVFFDEDGNGVAACDDPACADHSLCLMSYCTDESEAMLHNFHGVGRHPSCPYCGDGVCSDLETSIYSYCAEDCCGDGTCLGLELNDPEFYCEADCGGGGDLCGNDVCDEPGEDVENCLHDCDTCPNGICGPHESAVRCPADCS